MPRNPLFGGGQPPKPTAKTSLKPVGKLKKSPTVVRRNSPLGEEYKQYLLAFGYSEAFVIEHIRKGWGEHAPHPTQLPAVGF